MNLFKNFIAEESQDLSPEVCLKEGYVCAFKHPIEGDIIYFQCNQLPEGYLYGWERLTREDVINDFDKLDPKTKDSLLSMVGIESEAEWKDLSLCHQISDMKLIGYYFEEKQFVKTLEEVLCGVID